MEDTKDTEHKQTKNFTLNGKTVWLVKTKESGGLGASCDSCVYDWNVPGYEANACPYNEEHGRLECTIIEDELMHFTDGEQKVAQTVATVSSVPTALNVQVGGEHYKNMAIQPVTYIHANKLTFLEGNIVKYITRHKTKNKAQDIRKVIHYAQLILQLEYNETYEQESE